MGFEAELQGLERPTAGDASVTLRITTFISNAWYDATAPYHPTAVGVWSRLGRRPASEATPRNINTAVLYASYRVGLAFWSRRDVELRSMLTRVDLDPDDTSTDISTAVGLGNVAAQAVLDARRHDGMNQLGDEGGRRFHLRPYADYTGYRPVNSPYRLRRPDRWQPDIQRKRTVLFGPQFVLNDAGTYRTQVFVTPQYALVEPYSYRSLGQFRVPAPKASQRFRSAAYRRQADEVLRASGMFGRRPPAHPWWSRALRRYRTWCLHTIHGPSSTMIAAKVVCGRAFTFGRRSTPVRQFAMSLATWRMITSLT